MPLSISNKRLKRRTSFSLDSQREMWQSSRQSENPAMIACTLKRQTSRDTGITQLPRNQSETATSAMMFFTTELSVINNAKPH